MFVCFLLLCSVSVVIGVISHHHCLHRDTNQSSNFNPNPIPNPVQYLDIKTDLSLDDLPPLLAYHLMFLEVLSGCTVGRLNITTVEAKVQSVFNYADIVDSILDPGTIIVAQVRLSLFFYNSIIEVELKIPGLEQSACIWRLIESYNSVVGYAKDDVRTVEKLGWQAPEVSRQKIEHIMVCILITGGFFSRYYDPQTFRFSEHEQDGGDKVCCFGRCVLISCLVFVVCSSVRYVSAYAVCELCDLCDLYQPPFFPSVLPLVIRFCFHFCFH
jgi:hypothetical protein